MSKKETKTQYFTMNADKFMELLGQTQKDYSLFAELLKEKTSSQSSDNWQSEGVTDLIETFVIINSFKTLLDKKITDPPKEEIDFAVKNNIKDVLLTETELFLMQKFNKNIEEQKEMLETLYKFNLYLH